MRGELSRTLKSFQVELRLANWGGFSCWKNFHQIKIANRHYWLNAFLTKLESMLTENDNIKIILDADIIGAGIRNLNFCFFIFRKSVSLKY